MARDSMLGTFVVATVLCLVCSLVVSSAAVLLKPYQEANKAFDRQKNVLMAAGLLEDGMDRKAIEKTFAEVVTQVAVKLGTPEVVEVPKEYDPMEARNNPKENKTIDVDGPKPGLPTRENVGFIYEIAKAGKVQSYVIPISGKGLWSTLYGYLALANDGDTVVGISYYEHGETPGLGGEVESQKFKNDWKGKEIYDDEGVPAVKLVKGGVSEPGAEHKVDGLSGATITSNGVQNMVNYWLGPDGFGPFIKAQTGDKSDKS